VSVEQPRSALDGIRIIDAATLIAGPFVATVLGDFGADVIKVEHPRGDPVRTHGHQKDGVGLWWKVVGRNKRTMTIDLNRPEGQEIFCRLAATADVVIENFRPGTLERWHVGPEDLWKSNPRLIVVRMTGFGQFGPYSKRPGFGTIAESMSGFAHITGEAGGPPTLPPFGLADGVAGLAGAIATLLALYARDRAGGKGQVIDLAIIEPILTILGPQPTEYDQLGIVQTRSGNRSLNNAPRNTYQTRDGKWVAVSASAQSVAERVMTLVGRADLTAQPWFRSGAERARHADEIDAAVAGWIACRDIADVIHEFDAAEAAIAPIYDVADVMRDPQYAALHSLISVPDSEVGAITMQNVLFRMSGTPGAIRWAGRPIGADTDAILSELGYKQDRIAALHEAQSP
jgi:crotonobetainyl-CoA:carnitine CoA-transferase CaiB-like acyl-CoA transferase